MRNSVMYRRLWYLKKRNKVSMRIYSVLITLTCIFCLLIFFIQKNIFPYALEITEMKTRLLASEVVQEVIREEFGKSISYDDITFLERDAFNRVTSVQINVSKLNRLSSKITQKIIESSTEKSRKQIDIPIGMLIGNNVLAGQGPGVKFSFISFSQVSTNFKSEFVGTGINQTKHSICLEVKIKIGVNLPLIGDSNDVIVNIPLAETIIVGNVPRT